MKIDELKIIQRDLNPTPSAKVAMTIWGDEYSQRGEGVPVNQIWDGIDND